MQKITGTFSLTNPAQGVYAGMILAATGAMAARDDPNTYYKPEAWGNKGGKGIVDFDSSRNTRYNGNVTHGKQKGVKFIVKVL